MYKIVLLALLVFLIYGIQESQQQRCSEHYCTNSHNNDGCDGCCYGLNYHYGRCYGDKCYCYYNAIAAGVAGGGSTTLPPPA